MDISRQFSSTCESVFNTETIQIPSWLSKGEGVHWIHGKPGSGKSTLMKYIYNHPETSQFLSHWSRSGTLIKAGFFFYYRGSAMQKSFLGLLQSILLQILLGLPELCDEIPKECIPQAKGIPFDWSLGRLRRALEAVVKQQHFRLYICFFIDALDEFDGHLELIADFIEGLVSSETSTRTRAKILFSSRPRSILDTRFGDYPSFQIQQYTKGDVDRYTIGRIERCAGVVRQMHASQEARAAITIVLDEINQKADGVFLWVRLALDRITEVLESREIPTTEKMLSIVQALPFELDGFYISIIQRIPQHLRWDAYLTLDTLLRALEEPILGEIYQIIECSQQQTLQECKSRMDAAKDFSGMCCRLRDSCGGLIEIEEPFQISSRVRLMHETVREFLSEPTFEELIIGRQSLFRAQNGYTELAKLYLAALNGINVGHQRDPFSHTADLSMAETYCLLAETTTGISQRLLIDSLPDGVPTRWSPRKPQPPMYFACDASLFLYVKEKLDGNQNSHEVNSALEAIANAHAARLGLGHYSHWKSLPDDSRIAKFILSKSVQKGINDASASFGKFLWNVHKYENIAMEDRWPSVLEVAKAFLEHGQDPNMEMAHFERPRPLHVSGGHITKVLLSFKADVNAMDQKHRTPLDVMIRRVADLEAYIYPQRELDDTMFWETTNAIELLVEKGGCITQFGLKYYSSCLSVYSIRERRADCLQTLPQRSLENGFISLWDIRTVRIRRACEEVAVKMRRKSSSRIWDYDRE